MNMNIIKWLGQSGFEIKTNQKTILIDPFLNDNPKAPIEANEITNADIVCVTHDHTDHIGDSIEICKRTKATFVGSFELGNYAESKGVENVKGINIGGTLEVEGINITMVQAFHSSEQGPPTGFVLDIGEETIYHAGDTGVFGDMKLIGELYEPEIACLPIGDYYTMGSREAAEAVKLINPEKVIPMHYLTFPVLEQSANNFLEELEKRDIEVEPVVLEPGESCEF